MVQKKHITQGLEALGIQAGDVIHMHTSLRSLGPVEGGLDALTEGILELIGREGVFSVPTHTWANVGIHQPVFHVLHTPSNLGVYPNYFRQRGDAVRSVHPSHSVAAIGDRAAGFLEGHEKDTTPVSPSSPYGRLISWKGKIVLFGVNLTRNTFFHCLEEMAGCSELWSLTKETSKRWTIDHEGVVRELDYRSHTNGVSDHYYRCESELLHEGILVQGFVGPAPVKVLDAEKASRWLLPRLSDDTKYFW